MKKWMNEPRNFVNEMLEGILYAHGNMLKCVNGDIRCLVNAQLSEEPRVVIETGGGSGHLPLFLGYVGEGLLDGVAIGNVFASPSAAQMYEVTNAIHQGKGVLYLYGNYSGDIINFSMAAEMAEMEGIQVMQVVGNDDAASSKKGEESKRRGVAGMFYAYKTAGAYAREGACLEEVARIAQKTVDRTRTVGVALSPCIIPEVGKPGFSIGEDEMEIGMGIHGEPGIDRVKMLTADETAQRIIAHIFGDYSYSEGDRVSVLVNGLGATPLEELYIIFRKVYLLLQERKIHIHKTYVGEFATSMEMSGMSVSVLHLDDELERLIDQPCNTPFFKQI